MAPPELPSVDEHGYRYVPVEGVPYPPFSQARALADLRSNFRLRDSDVVIATYPKCGTTWMQQILLTLLRAPGGGAVSDPMVQAPWLEWMTSFAAIGLKKCLNGEPRSVQQLLEWDGSTPAGPAPLRRVFKTHAPVGLVPWAGGLGGLGGAKVVVVARNPKDACVSAFNHAKDVPQFEYSGDFEHFTAQIFLQGKAESGCFWEWHAAWHRAAQATPGILWISYEELKRDAPGSVRRLAGFLGLEAADELVAEVVAASSFEAMKATFAGTNEKKCAEGRSDDVKTNHIRQGLAGAWRKKFSGPLLAAFDARHAERMAAVGLEYDFDFGDEPMAEA